MGPITDCTSPCEGRERIRNPGRRVGDVMGDDKEIDRVLAQARAIFIAIFMSSRLRYIF